MKKEKEKKQRIDWRRTLRNNAYMLGLIIKVCPGVFRISMIWTVVGAVHSFFINTYLYKYALNALQEGLELRAILITLGAMFSFSLIYRICDHAIGVYFKLRYPIVEAYIQDLLHKKAAEVDLECFENSSFYDTYVKASGDATERAYNVMNNIENFIWVVIKVSMTAALIIAIEPIFLAIAVIPLIITALIGKKRNRIQYEYKMENKVAARQRDYVRRTFYLSDFSKEMRLTEMWKVMYRRMESSIAEMKRIVDKYGYKIMFFHYLFDFVFDILVYTGSIVLAAFRTLVSKTMLLGDCYVIINTITQIAYNLNYVGDVFLKLDENSLYVDNLRDFLEYEVKIAEDENAPEVGAFKSLELKNVSFSYSGQKEPALNSINMKICRGEKIAVVGHNGAGKTTLIKLLQRLYDPSEGAVLVNGEDIRGVRLSSYRGLFSSVFQDYRLFAVTVAENVMLRGNITDADRERVRDSLEKAGIADKIESLACGVDSNVTREFDSKGVMFSGGEAQKISIARVFAGDREIVIMDEPTSALDPIAEQEMYRNMFEACEGKTVIFISHRLSSATMADRVYMFENGRIIEEGTHGELLALNGKYADMWHKQADTYSGEAAV